MLIIFQARRKVAEALGLVVRDRRKERGGGERKNDMLEALFEGDGGGVEGGGGFSDEEIVDFMLALLVAGYETTSTIMTLAVKFLTETPHALSHLKVPFYSSLFYFILFIQSLFLFLNYLCILRQVNVSPLFYIIS